MNNKIFIYWIDLFSLPLTGDHRNWILVLSLKLAMSVAKLTTFIRDRTLNCTHLTQGKRKLRRNATSSSRNPKTETEIRNWIDLCCCCTDVIVTKWKQSEAVELNSFNTYYTWKQTCSIRVNVCLRKGNTLIFNTYSNIILN